jgi:DNA repair exonuclease SbcCD ATPase subunit
MTQVEYDETIFDGLDFVMMGDIHKRQSFRGGRIWYAGSMIQQNFGEDPDKGFLLWDIRDKDDYSVTFHELHGNRKFYTVPILHDLTLPDVEIDKGSRLRLTPPRQLTLVEQKAVERLAKRKFEPHDVITLGSQNIGQQFADVGKTVEKIENIRKLDVQERLIRDFFADKVADKVMNRMLDMNRKYQVSIEQKDDVARGVNWRVLKMGWNNLYNYGEGNVIDFSQVKGLTGIFAPNASGKSGMIDVITVGMFDCNTKEVAKNVHLINDNKDSAVAILELMANGERYTITRGIDRIKYGQRKKNEKEWGKTSLTFVRHDKDGGVENLNGELRPQTEAAIRKRFGGFDDFMLTSLFAQWDPMDLIMCKETDRKRILFRFLDLDIFEDKMKMAKEESKIWMKKLEEMEEGDHEGARDRLKERIEEVRKLIQSDEDFLNDYSIRATQVQSEIEKLLEEKSSVPQIEWKLHEELDAIHMAERSIAKHLQKIAEHEAIIQTQNDVIKVKSELQLQYAGKFEGGIQSRLEKCRREFDVLRSDLTIFANTEKELTRQASILDKVPCGDKFPTCQFLVDAFQAKKDVNYATESKNIALAEVEAKNAELKLLEDEMRSKTNYDAYGQNIRSCEQFIVQNSLAIEALQANIVTEETKKQQAESHIEAIEKAAADVLKNEAIDKQLDIARLNRREIERVIKNRRDELVEHTKEIGLLDGQMVALSKSLEQITEVREMCTAFEKFMEAMGKDGIALGILTQKLPMINEQINKILSQAAEFGAYIEYDKEEQSIRLYLQYGQYKSRILELGSGAEKFLASVAIRAALLSISNLPRSNMFIIDEGFGKLDPQNLEAIQRMFDYLKSVFDHVIVISHSDLMKDMVDNMIEITPDDEGYAHVEIGG